ncbi:tyrosine--tRNA ligase [Candidatus Microgenomates bacterium]|nr:tyrosine--tRNA ligase [Candidatus Microgenomates bacterium]
MAGAYALDLRDDWYIIPISLLVKKQAFSLQVKGQTPLPADSFGVILKAMPRVKKDAKLIDELLSRRVAKIFPSQNVLARLLRQRKIRLYQGFDPTGKLHIGNGIGLKLLMEFANAGHEVIFLFGTGTVLVGDPSQREGGRIEITAREINNYINGWRKQAAKIVDFKKIKIKQNADWLTKLTLKDIIGIASKLSAVQLFKRDSFQRRLNKGDTVWYHETMYPLLQGYDSVVMDVDLEIGGTDQEFNMLVGRELMKKMKNKDKYVLTLPLILGTDGQKMSASKGNCVWMDDPANEMYGKLMSVPDSQTMPYLKLCTDVPEDELKSLAKANPRDAKARMAYEITKLYHGAQVAGQAAKHFDAQFKKGDVPTNVAEYKRKQGKVAIHDLVVETGLAESRSEARRLVEQGGVKIDGKVCQTNDLVNLRPACPVLLQVGKRKFKRLSTK